MFPVYSLSLDLRAIFPTFALRSANHTSRRHISIHDYYRSMYTTNHACATICSIRLVAIFFSKAIANIKRTLIFYNIAWCTLDKQYNIRNLIYSLIYFNHIFLWQHHSINSYNYCFLPHISKILMKLLFNKVHSISD